MNVTFQSRRFSQECDVSQSLHESPMESGNHHFLVFLGKRVEVAFKVSVTLRSPAYSEELTLDG